MCPTCFAFNVRCLSFVTPNQIFLYLRLPHLIFVGSRDYAVPDVTKSALVVNLPPRAARPPMSLPAVQVGGVLDKPPNYDALYAAADIVNVHGANVPSLQGVSGNNVYAVPNADLLLSIDYSVLEFPRGKPQICRGAGRRTVWRGNILNIL